MSGGHEEALSAFREAAERYRQDQAEMIAKREAMDKAVAEKLAAERKLRSTADDFRRASETLTDALLAERGQA